MIFFLIKKIGIDKNAFHKNKYSISIDEVEINGVILFDKTSYGNKSSFKHYIGYRHKDGTTSPLNINLPQLTGYVKYFDNGDNLMTFLVADKELLKNTMKYGIRLKACSEKNLVKNLCKTINICTQLVN